MPFDCENPVAHESLEISLRFRRMIEERIERLESDAVNDEAFLVYLSNPDHIRRQMRLVATERAEAERMRRFLEGSKARGARPTISS